MQPDAGGLARGRRSRSTGSTELVEVVPTVATTAQASVRSSASGADPERVVDRRLAQLELEQPARLLDRRVRVLGGDDDARAGLRLPRRGERDHRARRGGVLDVAVQAVRQPEQLREPVERQLLELLQRRRGAPEDPDLVQPGAEQLGEDARLRAGGREVGEEARALPVRDRRQRASRRGRGARPRTARPSPAALGGSRARTSPGSTCASTGSSRSRSRYDATHSTAAAPSSRKSRSLRGSFSIAAHVRVLRICSFVSQARRAWATPSST